MLDTYAIKSYSAHTAANIFINCCSEFSGFDSFSSLSSCLDIPLSKADIPGSDSS